MVWRMYFLLLLLPIGARCQNFLNDTTFFGADYTNFHTGIEVDSGYFVVGMSLHAETNPMAEYLLGFIYKNGNKSILLQEYDTLNSQRVAFWEGSLFFNDRGNFVSCYANCDSETCFPRIKEVSRSGEVINDVSFKSFIQSIPGLTYDFGKIIQHSGDSSYWVFSNVVDSNNITGYYGGVLCLHLDSDFNQISSAYIDSPNNSRVYIPMDAVELDSGNVLLMVNRQRDAGWLSVNLESDIYFVELGPDCNIVETNIYSDSVVNDLPYALLRCDDGGYMFSYMKGYWHDDWDGWDYESYICRVDDDFSLVWKKQVVDVRVGLENELFNRGIKRTLDQNYISGTGYFLVDTNNVYFRTIQLNKFDGDGNFIWRRHHHKFDLPLDSTPQVVPVLRDVILNADGGYAMIGAIFDYDQLMSGNRGVYGYIVETNCLGFRGAPVAAASHSTDSNFVVHFYNTSMQAGSYKWNFGDGSSLSTSEYDTQISHQYTGNGPYTVELIAEGCNNENDTLRFEVFPEGISDTLIIDAPGDLLFYPNPLSSEQDLQFYMNPQDPLKGEIIMEIIALNGAIVRRIEVPSEGGNFNLSHQFASGKYQVKLTQGTTVFYKGKFVVN